jgi:hypothetical protein
MFSLTSQSYFVKYTDIADIQKDVYRKLFIIGLFSIGKDSK